MHEHTCGRCKASLRVYVVCCRVAVFGRGCGGCGFCVWVARRRVQVLRSGKFKAMAPFLREPACRLVKPEVLWEVRREEEETPGRPPQMWADPTPGASVDYYHPLSSKPACGVPVTWKAVPSQHCPSSAQLASTGGAV